MVLLVRPLGRSRFLSTLHTFPWQEKQWCFQRHQRHLSESVWLIHCSDDDLRTISIQLCNHTVVVSLVVSLLGTEHCAVLKNIVHGHQAQVSHSKPSKVKSIQGVILHMLKKLLECWVLALTNTGLEIQHICKILSIGCVPSHL